MTRPAHKTALLEAVRKDRTRWLDTASPLYSQAVTLAEELAREGKIQKRGDQLRRVDETKEAT